MLTDQITFVHKHFAGDNEGANFLLMGGAFFLSALVSL